MIPRFSIISSIAVLATLAISLPARALSDAQAGRQRYEVDMASWPATSAQGSTEIFALMVFGARMLLCSEGGRDAG
ncbi:MAG: hypothetical protein ACFB9N_14675 [Geitlerinemataceae cyanobacterium]